MRMWNVDPKQMCRKHLLGEHVEMHMFIGTLRKGNKLTGYIDGGLVEVQRIVKRHDVLAKEINRRGYTHRSPLPEGSADLLFRAGKVDPTNSLYELSKRCGDCRKQQNLCHQK